MYSEIIKTIESEKVRRNNIFLDRCAIGIEAAINAMSPLDATIFIKNLLDLNLVPSKAIVDDVKSGMPLYTAYCKHS
jgi:hypothetical protein